VAVACIFPNPINKEIDIDLFNDSKKLSKKQRENTFGHINKLIKKSLINYKIGTANVEEIDSMNILKASLLAMKRAVDKFSHLSKENVLVIVDGIHKPELKDIDCKTIVKGDQKSVSIAAASIIAKIYRDKLMIKLSKSFPVYDWENNMGYGTKKHLEGIKSSGITKHHRKSFKPIKSFIQKNS